MDPLDDKELEHLLRQWTAPPTPAGLGQRVLARRESWWRWLLTGTIRVPVPIGVAVMVAVGFWIYSSVAVRSPALRPAVSVSLADFQPVPQLEPRIVGEQK